MAEPHSRWGPKATAAAKNFIKEWKAHPNLGYFPRDHAGYCWSPKLPSTELATPPRAVQKAARYSSAAFWSASTFCVSFKGALKALVAAWRRFPSPGSSWIWQVGTLCRAVGMGSCLPLTICQTQCSIGPRTMLEDTPHILS